MSDIPTPPPHTNIVTYADDITILTSHTNPQTAQTVQPYLDQIHTWTQDNQLTLNASKTTATLFTPDPAEYSTNLTLNINNTQIPTNKEPKILGITFDPKYTFSKHTQNTATKAQKTVHILKALTTTHWGKTKETLLTTYKTITRPILEYASTIWSPIISNTNTTKLQTQQNTALRTITGCTLDTNTQHLHAETLVLPIKEHLQLHASQYRQKSQHTEHPLHHLTRQPPNPRHMKETIYDNVNYTTNLDTPPDNTTHTTIKQNMKTIHTQLVHDYTQSLHNKILNTKPPPINPAEQSLPHNIRRIMAQLRTNKSPVLESYLHKITPDTHPSPTCSLCKQNTHDTTHLFNCPNLSTNLSPGDLWTDPVEVAGLLADWSDQAGWGLRTA